MAARGALVMSRHAGWLGTVIEISARSAEEAVSTAATQAVMAEIERLQAVFDAFDPGSDLRRWLAGAAAASPELVVVLDLAERWRGRSGGAFDPAAEVLTRLWRGAAARDRLPDRSEIDAALAAIDSAVRPTAPQWHAPDVPYALNAVAKGWIVDRAAEAAWRLPGLEALTVNAGGDLVHRGAAAIVVGIEDPAGPHDNAPPLTAIALRDAAIATSGGARRGWTIGGSWYSHVIDPRTGWPVDHHASVSVLAPDAATADVVATVVGVLPRAEALEVVHGLDGIDCCLVAGDGTVQRTAGWVAAELRPGS